MSSATPVSSRSNAAFGFANCANGSTVNPDIFVFGSNLAGRHGAGAAKEARLKYGAIYGQAMGRQGNSYAIPTKDEHLRPLPLEDIHDYVDTFRNYAIAHPELRFNVTRIGCGLAGYSDVEIAPMFRHAPTNCRLPEEWQRLLRVETFLGH